MSLLCIICAIEQQNLKDVLPARYIVNGQSVCHNHVLHVQSDRIDGIVQIKRTDTP